LTWVLKKGIIDLIIDAREEDFMKREKMTGKTKMIWALLIAGFGLMEFPGVFFFQDKLTPFIFGFPFIYGYIICGWIYMCLVLLYAYKTNWGRPQSR
jgi:uncharacterized membrane protein